MTKPKPFAYLAVQNLRAKTHSSYAMGDEEFTRKAIDGWKSDPPINLKPDELSESKTEPDFTHESALTEALSKAVDFGLSQYELIGVSSVAPSLFGGVMSKERVIRPTTETAVLIEEEGATALFSLNEDQYLDLLSRQSDWKQLEAGLAALPKATLMSIVATFDTTVVDIVSKMLRLGRQEWLVKTERAIPASKLSSALTVEELIQEVISEEMYQFSRGSHDEQVKYIETTFGVGIKKSWKRWPDYIEVFERRNLIAHGETHFNKRYVDICKSSGHKGSEKVLGTSIDLTPAYLNQACDVLLEFSVLLPFSLWRKVDREKERQAFWNLSEASFKLIASKRYRPAERIIEFALSLEKSDIPLDLRSRLVVNRACALKHLGDEAAANEALDAVDWSASSDLFKICVAGVKGDVSTVSALLPAVQATDVLDARSFKQWPCFSFVRDNPTVRETFQECFGLTLAGSNVSDAKTEVREGEGPAAKPSAPDDTVH